MIQIGDIVEVISDDGTKFVTYYCGEAEHCGKHYKLVSPYQDDRPKHWLELDTEIKRV